MPVTRRALLRAGLLVGSATLLKGCIQPAPPAAPQGASKEVTITYWNGLTGADGPIMDELVERFTRETGIKVEQQRIPWVDLYAKLQVAAPAGEGPDMCLMHTGEIPHFADDGIIEPIDEKTLAEKGFRGEDYTPAPWDGGTYQSKRYAVPLDIPQHVLYLHNQVLRDAGLAGPDGTPKVPTSKAELVSMAQQMTKGDNFGLIVGATSGVGAVWGFHNLLWQNDANIFTPDLKKAAVAEPAAIEVAEFLGSLYADLHVAPPVGTVSLDAFQAGKVGMWIGGSWNIVGLRSAKIDFTAAPLPTIFKQPAVWTSPHQFTFPKPKQRDEAKREAAWNQIRWITDHVIDWTLRAGQVSPRTKVQQDPSVTGDPVLRVFAGQAPHWQVAQPTTKWPRAESLTVPQIEAIYSGQKRAADAVGELATQIDAL